MVRLQPSMPRHSTVSRAIVLACAAVSAPPEGMRIADPTFVRTSDLWELELPAGERISGPRGDASRHAAGLPNLPTGSKIALAEHELDGVGVGGSLWRSAGALCRWQLRNADEIRGKKVLELGAGTGASGLFAAALGASSVTLTDGTDGLVPLLTRNAEHNRERGVIGADTAVAIGPWRFGETPPACAAGETYDIVIGSDITYAVHEAGDALCDLLGDLLRSGTARRCVIAHEHRREDIFDVDAIVANEPAAEWNEKDCCLGYFLDYAEKAGLRVTPLAFEPGFCRQRNDGVVEMTTDLSVFEVQAVAEE